MSDFLYVEVWTQVAAHSGRQRLYQIPPDELLDLELVDGVDVPDRGTLVVCSEWTRISSLKKGRVIRVCYDDSADDEEWRIADVQDGNGPGPRETIVTLDPIAADLNNAEYRSVDAVGISRHDYSAAMIDAETVIDDAVLPSLVERDIDWFSRGTVDSPKTFDIETSDGDTAQSILRELCDPSKTNGELLVRRNGETNFKIDILDEIGGSAAPARVRTARGLASWKRRFTSDETFNLLRPRAGEDGTCRSIEFAFWKVVTVVGGGTPYVEAEDPRGPTNYPGPGRVADQQNGLYLHRAYSSTHASEEITDTEIVSSSRTRWYMASSADFTVGMLVDLRDGPALTDTRVDALGHPAALAAHGMVFGKSLPFDTLSGGINYASDPWLADWSEWYDVGATSTTATYSTASAVVTRNAGVNFNQFVEVGDRLIRSSDSTVIGTVLTVDSANQVTLTANATISGSAVAVKFQKKKPAGWTVAISALAGTFEARRNTTGEAYGPDRWYIRSSSAIAMTIDTPVFTPEKDTLRHRFWEWLRMIGTNAVAGDFQVTLRKASDNSVIGSVSEILADQAGKAVQIPFEPDDISGSATGVYIRIQFGAGWAGDFYIEAIGCQPLSFTSTESYGPFATGQKCAQDLWHVTNDALENAVEPQGFDLDIANPDDVAEVDGVIVRGGPVVVEDEYLDLIGADAVTLRAMEITRRPLTDPNRPKVRLGFRPVNLSEILVRRVPTTGAVAREIAAGMRSAVATGSINTALNVVKDISVKDSGGVEVGTFSLGAGTFADGQALAISEVFKRKK